MPTFGFIEVFSLYSRDTGVSKLITEEFGQTCHTAWFTHCAWQNNLQKLCFITSQ